LNQFGLSGTYRCLEMIVNDFSSFVKIQNCADIAEGGSRRLCVRFNPTLDCLPSVVLAENQLGNLRPP